MTQRVAGEHRYGLGRLFLIALAFVTAAPLFWQRVELHQGSVVETYENADLYQLVYPAMEHGFGRLRERELPLWNSRQWCGVPFAADPRLGLFQPLNALFLVMPTARAMAVHAFVALCLMGVFCVLFFRALGVGYPAALFGAAVYAFSGASAAAMSRPSMAAALAWTPFLFWAVTETIRQAKPAPAVLAGLGFAALLLTGANGLVVAMVLALAPYLVLTWVKVGAPSKTAFVMQMGVLALAFSMGLAIAAIQWAPALSWMIGTGAFDGSFWNIHTAAQVPLKVRDLFSQLVMAEPGKLPRPGYFGIISLLFVPLAFLHRPLRSYAFLFFILGSLSLMGLLTDKSMYPVEFPPQTFAWSGMFSIAVLATLGADRLFSARRDRLDVRPWVPMLIILAMAAVLFVLFSSLVRGYIIALLLLVLPFLAFRNAWSAGLSGVLMTVLLFVDLMNANTNSYGHPFQDAPECYRLQSVLFQTAEEQAAGSRVFVSSSRQSVSLTPNLGMLTPLHVANGTHLMRSAAQVAWWARALPELPSSDAVASDPAHFGLLNFAAPRILLADSFGPIPLDVGPEQGLLLRDIRSDGNAHVYINGRALGRAYWVPACTVVEGVEQAVDTLGQADFDRDRACTVDRQSRGFEFEAERLPTLTPEQARGKGPSWRDAAATVEEPSPEEVRVYVNAPQAGVVVLADTFDPDWQATLNGAPCRILRVNGIFRGVAVPPGEHVITYRYKPHSFAVGSAVSVATLALLAALGVAGLMKPTGSRTLAPTPTRATPLKRAPKPSSPPR